LAELNLVAMAVAGVVPCEQDTILLRLCQGVSRK